MEYRLLADLEAIAVLDAIPENIRTRLPGHLIKLRATSEQHSDYHEHDSIGRRVEISAVAGYSIHYWIDAADRHVKVSAIKTADR